MRIEYEHFKLYVFNSEYYFYGWNNWSLVGSFICYYYELIEKEIIRNKKLKRNVLYSINLFIERDLDDPEKLMDWRFELKTVNENKFEEVKRISQEIRQFEEEDKDIIADRLDELAIELKNMRGK